MFLKCLICYAELLSDVICERTTDYELCKQIHLTKGNQIPEAHSQENSPTPTKGIFHAGYCISSVVLIVQIADFDLWLPAWDVWLFSPTTISIKSIMALLRNFSINFQWKAKKTSSLEDPVLASALCLHASKAKKLHTLLKFSCIFCLKWLCFALMVTSTNTQIQKLEPLVFTYDIKG